MACLFSGAMRYAFPGVFREVYSVAVGGMFFFGNSTTMSRLVALERFGMWPSGICYFEKELRISWNRD